MIIIALAMAKSEEAMVKGNSYLNVKTQTRDGMNLSIYPGRQSSPGFALRHW